MNREALEAIESDDLKSAENKLREALHADIFHGPAHANLGVLLIRKGDYYNAACELEFARKLLPHAPQPRANLAALFEAVGKYGEAEEQLREALRFSPEDIEIIGQLARIHVRQNRCTDETREWLGQIAAEHDDAQWRNWARQLLTTRLSRE